MTITVLRKEDHDPDNLERLASCGRPVPWVRVALLDEDGNEVPDGEPGEICVRGTLSSAGYWKKPEQTAELFAHGWLHTGDIARRDDEGFLYIVDRKKDMIISGGFNIFPREVEDVLSSHPGVAAAAVIGVPDEKWGEAVKAVVVRRPGSDVTEAELAALVKERKGAHHTPEEHRLRRLDPGLGARQARQEGAAGGLLGAGRPSGQLTPAIRTSRGTRSGRARRCTGS